MLFHKQLLICASSALQSANLGSVGTGGSLITYQTSFYQEERLQLPVPTKHNYYHLDEWR